MLHAPSRWQYLDWAIEMKNSVKTLLVLPTIALLAGLSGCASGQPPVVEKMDAVTAVTITHSRTPLILSPETPYDRDAARDYVQIGAIEVNRMGALRYFLWLGIARVDDLAEAQNPPAGFESIELLAGGERIKLDVSGWSPAAIGAGEPVYKKLFRESADAYYETGLDTIQALAATDDLKLYTTGTDATEFVLLYKQDTAKDDLAEFVQAVLQ